MMKKRTYCGNEKLGTYIKETKTGYTLYNKHTEVLTTKHVNDAISVYNKVIEPKLTGGYEWGDEFW